jgi:sigma-B regulation protein RsbU (phosphoserine phosphatase)
MTDSSPSPVPIADAGARLTRRIEKLKQCFSLCAVINSTLELSEVLDRIMSTSRRALGAETCSLLLVDESPDPDAANWSSRWPRGP